MCKFVSGWHMVFNFLMFVLIWIALRTSSDCSLLGLARCELHADLHSIGLIIFLKTGV